MPSDHDDPQPLTPDQIEALRNDLLLSRVIAHTDARRLIATVDTERARAERAEQEAAALAAAVQQLQEDGERAEQRLAAITDAARIAERALRDLPMQAFRTRAAQLRRSTAIDALRALLNAPTESDQILRLTAEAEPRSPESAAAIEHVLRETYDRLAHPDPASEE